MQPKRADDMLKDLRGQLFSATRRGFRREGTLAWTAIDERREATHAEVYATNCVIYSDVKDG